MDALVIVGIAVGSVVIGLLAGRLFAKSVSGSAQLSADDIRRQVGDAAREQLLAIAQTLETSTEQRLQTTTQSIAEQNRLANTSMEAMIKPLQETLKSLDAKVVDLENKRIEAYTSVQEQVKTTNAALEALRSETTMLSGALRRSDTRGRWGELQLRRIIEMMNMSEHISFSEQIQQQGDGSGKPDFTVYLPGNRVLYLDSKAPMSSYLDAINETDHVRKNELLDAHAKALKSHIKTLSNRSYASDETALNYVIMFIPTESSLAAACEINPSLIEDAAASGVVLTSPTSLVAVLSNISMLWQQDAQNQNAYEILRSSQELHSRLSVFINHFTKIGSNLKKSVESFNDAVSSFDTRVMKTATDIQKMGRYTDELPNVPKLEVEPKNSKYEQPELDS